jgi:hypothetical protein
MNLEQKITAFLATAETQPPQSKLEPYTELIRSLRQKRWPYHRIAKALQDDFGIKSAPSSIHNFVKVRAKKMDRCVIAPPATTSIRSLNPTPPAVPEIKRRRFNIDA